MTDSNPTLPAVRRQVRIAALAATAIVGSLLTNSLVREAAARSRVDRATEHAATLARDGVHAFGVRNESGPLMEIPVGADSMVMAARIGTGTGTGGTWAVRVAHVAPERFQLKATGRVIAGRTSVMCSFDVTLRVEDGGVIRPPIGVTDEPMCNGSPYRSAVRPVRTIGS